MNKKVFYWSLYDFANSIVMIAFLFYFSQWLVIDQGKPSWWYNGSLILASVLFFICTPYISRKIDETGRKISGLRITTIICMIGFTITAMITLFAPHLALLATISYAFSMFVYLLSFLYFTPMLNDLSTPENRAHISGIGQGVNSFGQVAGLLLTLPFATGVIVLFGAHGRAQTLLPSIILFCIFAAPMLFLYKEESTIATNKTLNTTNYNPITLFKTIIKNKNLALLLFGYFFFSDALLTFANNFPLYLQKVFLVSDTTKALLTIMILTLAGVGAFIFGKIADKKGHKKVLTTLLIIWSILFILLACTNSFSLVVPLCIFAGIFYGPVWGISRAMVGIYADKDMIGSSFSYYTLAERFATFVGPVVWSMVILSVGETAAGYRSGILSMGILMMIGLLVIRKVDEKQTA